MGVQGWVYDTQRQGHAWSEQVTYFPQGLEGLVSHPQSTRVAPSAKVRLTTTVLNVHEKHLVPQSTPSQAR